MKTDTFDYGNTAELYTVGHPRSGRRTMGFKRFDSAAKAIRYCMEELPANSLRGGVLEVGQRRYRHLQIRELYESAHFPLPRKKEPTANAA